MTSRAHRRYSRAIEALVIILGTVVLLKLFDARGAEVPVPPFAAIAAIESGGDHSAVGEAGERGAWQMSRAAWTQVNRARARRGASTHPFAEAHSPAIAKVYVAEYLGWLTGRFEASQGRLPTAGETYALWNLGFEGFRKRGFRLRDCPAITRRGAARMSAQP
jgi:hypothetical protein